MKKFAGDQKAAVKRAIFDFFESALPHHQSGLLYISTAIIGAINGVAFMMEKEGFSKEKALGIVIDDITRSLDASDFDGVREDVRRFIVQQRKTGIL